MMSARAAVAAAAAAASGGKVGETRQNSFFIAGTSTEGRTGVNYYSNQRSNLLTKKCGRSNASIYASIGATTFFEIRVFTFTFEKAPSRPFATARVYKNYRI